MTLSYISYEKEKSNWLEISKIFLKHSQALQSGANIRDLWEHVVPSEMREKMIEIMRQEERRIENEIRSKVAHEW